MGPPWCQIPFLDTVGTESIGTMADIRGHPCRDSATISQTMNNEFFPGIAGVFFNRSGVSIHCGF